MFGLSGLFINISSLVKTRAWSQIKDWVPLITCSKFQDTVVTLEGLTSILSLMRFDLNHPSVKKGWFVFLGSVFHGGLCGPATEQYTTFRIRVSALMRRKSQLLLPNSEKTHLIKYKIFLVLKPIIQTLIIPSSMIEEHWDLRVRRSKQYLILDPTMFWFWLANWYYYIQGVL